MIFLLFLCFSCLYLRIAKCNSLVSLLLSSLPVLLFWTIIIGGQYNVGTDYFNYLQYFKAPTMSYEPLFSIISIWLSECGILGQGQFFFYGALNAILLFIGGYRFGIKNWSLFFFLFIVVSTFFNNQMNGIRQCVATAILFWAFAEFRYSKIRGVLLVLIASGFHLSALVCLLFVFIEKASDIATAYPKLLMMLVAIIPFVDFGDSLNSELLNLLPSEALDSTRYARYGTSDYQESNMQLIYKLSKTLLIPVYWMSLKTLKSRNISSNELFLYKFGFLSFILRNLFLVNIFVARLSYYFWIPSVFPIYLYIIYLSRKKQALFSLVICLYLLLFYFAKIISGTPGYSYEFFV